MQLFKYIYVYTTFLLVLIFSASEADAQQVWHSRQIPEFFSLGHDTTHVRSRIGYVLSDRVMGMRTPIDTVRYDRHGYRISPQIRLAYDSLGRLTDRREEGSFGPRSFHHIDYNVEGAVSYFSEISYEAGGFDAADIIPDTIVHSYRLVACDRHPSFGIMRLVYRGTHTHAYPAVYNMSPVTTYDTLTFGRTLDGRQRVIQEYCEHSPLQDLDQQVYYYYDANGRLSGRKTVRWNQSSDTVVYQYNIMSELIGYSGTGALDGRHFDILLRCQPNGIPVQQTLIEFLTHWDDIAQQWMEVQETTRYYYDQRGNLSRQELPDTPIKEWDYKYWNE